MGATAVVVRIYSCLSKIQRNEEVAEASEVTCAVKVFLKLN